MIAPAGVSDSGSRRSGRETRRGRHHRGRSFATAGASTDFTLCDVPVTSDSGTPPYDVRISDPLAGPPAWACVQVDDVHQRVSLDAGGGQGVVAITAGYDTA